MIIRARQGEPYWYITSNCTGHLWKVEMAYDYHHEMDDTRYEKGNYFTSSNDADLFLVRIRDLFKRRWEDRPLLNDNYFETEHEQ